VPVEPKLAMVSGETMTFWMEKGNGVLPLSEMMPD
jgi:hypothetical protein